MSLSSFVGLMTHTLNLRKRNRNVSGDFYDLTSTNDLKGFIEYGNHFITTEKDENLKSTAIIYLLDDCGIDISWEHWMIDQTAPYSRVNMEVLKIDPIDDPRNGNTHHFEIHVR